MAKNLNVKSVVTFGEKVSEYSWPLMSEQELNRMQRRFPSLVTKLVAAGTDKSIGINPDPSFSSTANRNTFEYAFIVTDEQGKPWHDVILRYYDLPEAQSEWLKGLLSGEMKEFEGKAKKVKRTK
jgi:hypothetical protein